MSIRISLTNIPYRILSEEQKEVLNVYHRIIGSGRTYFTCNKDLSSIFTETASNENILFLNNIIRKILLERFLFGFKFFTSYYTRDGIKKGQIGFESKNYGIFCTAVDIQNFNKELFIGYIKEKNLVYCNSYIANCLNNLFKHYGKDIFITPRFDDNVYKIFDYDLNWFSLGEIQKVYNEVRKKSENVFLRPVSSEKLIQLLEENGYSIVKIKASNSKFIPLEERKNYPIVELKGTKRYFIKK